MYLTRHVVNLTAGTSGTSTGYTDDICNGYVRAVRYVISTSSPIPTTGTITITGEESGLTVLETTGPAASVTFFPKSRAVLSSDASNVFHTTEAQTAESQTELIPVAKERIKFVVASGATSEVEGTFHVYVG